MRLYEALKAGEAYLAEHQVQDAATDAWYLLEHALKKTGSAPANRAWFLANRREEMGAQAEGEYRELLHMRGARVPLQHITGEQEFMGIPFFVNENVLIPRQDTEILAEEAMKAIRPGDAVLDMCTGSGCIIISLAKLVPGIRAAACDISGKALEVARENARMQKADIDFRQGDLFEPVSGRFDMIVSNPPYIPTAEIQGLMDEVRLHEPMAALDGSADGLKFYRRLAAEAPGYLKSGGRMILEIGWNQGPQVAELMEGAGFGEIEVKHDLAGLDRVVKGRLLTGTEEKNV